MKYELKVIWKVKVNTLQCKANSIRSYQRSYFDILSDVANYVSKKLFPLARRYFCFVLFNETTDNIK